MIKSLTFWYGCGIDAGHMIHLKISNFELHIEMDAQVVRCITIGRGNLCDVVLPGDIEVSRLHAVVVPRPDGRIELRDLSSKSGTYVYLRGKKVRLLQTTEKKGSEKGRVTLASGDRFEIGSYTVEVQFEEVDGEPTIQPEYCEDEITEVE